MHIPVLEREVIKFLDPRSGQNFIDGTAGSGGHSLAILEKTAPDGKVLMIDWDESALKRIEEKIANQPDLKKRVILANGNFAETVRIAQENNFWPVDGILLDLGFSSDQLKESGRGFSFQRNEPLDMRYSLKQALTAEEIINHWPSEKLEKILKEYGEEKFAGRIVQKITEARKIKSIKTTAELTEIIREAVPRRYQYARIHFATKSFQSIRIATNNELGNLEEFLPPSFSLLGPGGRLAIISFHSLEDRIVKFFFRQLAKNKQVEILTKKPIRPANEEIAANPKSRSAKLRAIRKL